MDGRLAVGLTLFLACLVARESWGQDNGELVDIPEEMKGIWNGFFKWRVMEDNFWCVNAVWKSPRTVIIMGGVVDEEDEQMCMDTSVVNFTSGMYTLSSHFVVNYTSIQCKADGLLEFESQEVLGDEEGRVQLGSERCAIGKRADDENGPRLLYVLGPPVSANEPGVPDPICPLNIEDRDYQRVFGFMDLRAVSSDILVDISNFTCA